MKLAYIAGPYRANSEYGVLSNIRKAEQYALKYWQKGYAVICPHKNTALFGGSLPESAWLEGDLEILRRCDVVVMIPGWRASTGAVQEFTLASDLRMEIVFEE
jgi:hypothetical protein